MLHLSRSVFRYEELGLCKQRMMKRPLEKTKMQHVYVGSLTGIWSGLDQLRFLSAEDCTDLHVKRSKAAKALLYFIVAVKHASVSPIWIHIVCTCNGLWRRTFCVDVHEGVCLRDRKRKTRLREPVCFNRTACQKVGQLWILLVINLVQQF